jgi:hypothetical protein
MTGRTIQLRALLARAVDLRERLQLWPADGDADDSELIASFRIKNRFTVTESTILISVVPIRKEVVSSR